MCFEHMFSTNHKIRSNKWQNAKVINNNFSYVGVLILGAEYSNIYKVTEAK